MTLSKKERNKLWYEKNKERILVNRKEYYNKNKEKILANQKEYHIKHREQILPKQKIYGKQYRTLNSEKEKERKKQYYQDNIEKINQYLKQWIEKKPSYQKEYQKEYRKQYLKTPNGKISKKKSFAKRKRELSYIVLNKSEATMPFFEGHHLDKEYVLFIPKELHRSIYHNIYTGYNMDIINEKAIDWYIEYNKLN